jgi:hypothetical protein
MGQLFGPTRRSRESGTLRAENTKPYFAEARTRTNSALAPVSTRARTPECLRSRRPHSYLAGGFAGAFDFADGDWRVGQRLEFGPTHVLDAGLQV